MKKMTSFVTLAGVLGMAMACQVFDDGQENG